MKIQGDLQRIELKTLDPTRPGRFTVEITGVCTDEEWERLAKYFKSRHAVTTHVHDDDLGREVVIEL